MQLKTSFLLVLAVLLCALPARASEALQSALTAVLVALPQPPSTETVDERQARMGGIGEAIASASSRAVCEPPWDRIDEPCRKIWPGGKVELSAMLAGLAYMESALSERVHAGRCELARGECDARRERGVLVPGAKSIFQLQRTGYTNEVWHYLEGKGEWSTFVSAWSAARVLSAARTMCARRQPTIPWALGTVSAYATGGHCDWPRASKRVAFIVRIESRLRIEMSPKPPRMDVVDERL